MKMLLSSTSTRYCQNENFCLFLWLICCLIVFCIHYQIKYYKQTKRNLNNLIQIYTNPTPHYFNHSLVNVKTNANGKR